MEEKTQIGPKWLKNGSIDEVEFCQRFRRKHDIICVGGSFFGVQGRITDPGQVRKWIYSEIAPYVTRNISRKVDMLYQALRLDSSGCTLMEGPLLIHPANGTYDLLRGFSESKHYCRSRLRANYDPQAPEPKQWLAFLEELLEPEDILTLQEYLGYCLVPCTLAQKMLIITGSGGEGKSRIGVVMKALLGDAMGVSSLNKVETNRFARADLEHLLLMVDDDLKLEALPDTGYIKSIITAETPMDLERKGEQSYQGTLNVRFLAFGNDTLQALHDRSYGFFRRQIILTAKPIRPDRVDDPLLAIKMKEELDGIFMWALAGLERLWDNDLQFTQSAAARENLRQSMESGNNILQFLESEGYFRFDPLEMVSSRLLYDIYRRWCEDNMLTPLRSNTFWSFLTQHHRRYGLQPTRSVPIGQGKYARGFIGIRPLPRF